MQNSRAALARAQDKSSAFGEEEKILRAWEKWYNEAFASVMTLPVPPPSSALFQAVANAQKNFGKAANQNLQRLRKQRSRAKSKG
ncbi:hypothetical protein HUU05_23645 [candidate division KSB1 bacterium]|nr:hypothetical protein [candidate division KSB1 bacterium]